MSDIRDNLFYTAEHEWVSVDGDIATVGITDFAQSSLGDLVFVELPEAGTNAIVGEQIAVVESVKAASEVYSPLTGEVVEVNSELEESPEVINQHPFDDGWLMKVKLKDKGELDELMPADQYKDYIDGLE
ncbi:MAG: glycine cleavage system protein GcvH [Pseudomonadota bacterium]|nr:glycine cleavage system protein H [Magnetococcales bacterium]MEC8466940.1 glycine cleavage system protein GcvH [Pseudomonadota bacterium]